MGIQKLIGQICKKLRKEKSVDCIVDELEEDYEVVSKICDIAKRYAPDYDENKIYEEYSRIKN